jgi:hypothetical protein
MTAHKTPFTEEKSVKSPEMYHLEPEAYALPGEINAMKNCTHCNRGLATMSGEVDVLFIARLSPFDRTQGPCAEEKSVKSTEIFHLDPVE